jgi:anti-sigma regulatory factor (Ser/Thr protein kinase)
VDELLANISSHASESINEALEINIQLHYKPSHLQLTISDNGAPVNPLQADALQEPAAGRPAAVAAAAAAPDSTTVHWTA